MEWLIGCKMEVWNIFIVTCRMVGRYRRLSLILWSKWTNPVDARTVSVAADAHRMIRDKNFKRNSSKVIRFDQSRHFVLEFLFWLFQSSIQYLWIINVLLAYQIQTGWDFYPVVDLFPASRRLGGKYRIHDKKKLSRQAVLFPYFKWINPIISLPL